MPVPEGRARGSSGSSRSWPRPSPGRSRRVARWLPRPGGRPPAIRSGDGRSLSGQGAQDPATGKRSHGDVTRQTQQILENIGVLLKAAGLTLHDVVKVGVFLTDMHDFQAMNAVYAARFEPPYP